MLARIVWDDENPDYHYQSRTRQKGWKSADNPPAVMRVFPVAREGAGDFRVNLAKPYDWKPAIIRVNGGSVQDLNFLTGPHRAQYNRTGWPMQAYLPMSGNLLDGEFIGGFFRFMTLTPSDLPYVAGMTITNTPALVHRFTCVTWDRKTRSTKHINSTGTKRGDVFYFLVTKEGEAFIPARYVRPL